MGWAKGSRLFSELIDSISGAIDDEEVRETVYSLMIDSFEEFDCDTLDECIGEDPAFDRAFVEKHPEWNDEEE